MGGDPNEAITSRLKWLAPDPVAYDFIDSDLRTLAAFGLKPPNTRH